MLHFQLEVHVLTTKKCFVFTLYEETIDRFGKDVMMHGLEQPMRMKPTQTKVGVNCNLSPISSLAYTRAVYQNCKQLIETHH